MTATKYLKHTKVWSDSERSTDVAEKISGKDLKRVKISHTTDAKSQHHKKTDT